MKEKIYTIPINEAFDVECECNICELERKLENECVDYILGPSLMEPDGRIETNEKGFCRNHFELLYNKQVNRLGLGLILDTHLIEQNKKLTELYDKSKASFNKAKNMSFSGKLLSKIRNSNDDSQKSIDEIISHLSSLEDTCTICTKLDFTMDRYIDVILYLWFSEPEFKSKFNNTKGFCLRHTKQLLMGCKKYLDIPQSAVFTENLLALQLTNLKRIQEEVFYFTKKFDYRYTDAPWGNSKDAVPRSIQKIAGYCDINK